ncbi:hypothetical protein NDU88_005967 [Pleurodeles waltl]|uniref:Uncharacterized protein n=1 Tax=Pleurodeles waltl TaxID=8319 RepID=A0AAV7X098_PLEWA|nr:hypothetical protein NDU88_005967 [Pleurodeles waltl]
MESQQRFSFHFPLAHRPGMCHSHTGVKPKAALGALDQVICNRSGLNWCGGKSFQSALHSSALFILEIVLQGQSVSYWPGHMQGQPAIPRRAHLLLCGDQRQLDPAPQGLIFLYCTCLCKQAVMSVPSLTVLCRKQAGRPHLLLQPRRVVTRG